MIRAGRQLKKAKKFCAIEHKQVADRKPSVSIANNGSRFVARSTMDHPREGRLEGYIITEGDESLLFEDIEMEGIPDEPEVPNSSTSAAAAAAEEPDLLVQLTQERAANLQLITDLNYSVSQQQILFEKLKEATQKCEQMESKHLEVLIKQEEEFENDMITQEEAFEQEMDIREKKFQKEKKTLEDNYEKKVRDLEMKQECQVLKLESRIGCLERELKLEKNLRREVEIKGIRLREKGQSQGRAGGRTSFGKRGKVSQVTTPKVLSPPSSRKAGLRKSDRVRKSKLRCAFSVCGGRRCSNAGVMTEKEPAKVQMTSSSSPDVSPRPELVVVAGPRCSKSGNSSQALKLLEQQHRLINKKEAKSTGRYLCSCGSKFGTVGCFSKHVRIKSIGKIFECPHCSMRFDRHGNLKSHARRIHQAEVGDHACGDCAKIFDTGRELWNHKKEENCKWQPGHFQNAN